MTRSPSKFHRMVRNIRIMEAKDEELLRLRALRTAAEAFVEGGTVGEFEDLAAAVEAAKEKM